MLSENDYERIMKYIAAHNSFEYGKGLSTYGQLTNKEIPINFKR